MFKLVRIDDDHHQEIPLSDGKQVIGRGNLLDCDDKRVSRSHAELEIVEDTVIVKSLHTNPCFIVNTMGEAKVIYQNTSEKVSLRYKIGFTNNKYWYTFCKNDENDICLSIEDFQPLKDIINKHKDIGAIKYEASEENCKKSEKNMTDEQISNTTENKKTDNKVSVSPSILTDDLKTQELISNHLNNDKSSEEQLDHSLSQSPGKRLIKQEPTSPVDIKKLKTEGTERPHSAASRASTSGASSASASPPPNNQIRKRERCMYGHKCYRKNAEHKGQFSHPGDLDWGSGAQAACPWGYACARRDPRHWRDHTHPYGMHPPPPAGVQKKKTHIVQRNGKIFYINAHAVNFFDDHFEAEDSDGDSVDYDYEFDCSD